MKKKAKICACSLILLFAIGFSGCGGGDESSDSKSTMPKANAGNDITVNKYTPVSLDASQSSNTNSYKWTQIEGPGAGLSDDESVSPKFTPKSAATYKFKVEATNAGGKDTDEIVVVAQDISTISILSPTPDDSIALTESSLTISGSAGQYIATVTLTNKTTGVSYSGLLDGNGLFSFGNVALQNGDNILEVVGTDNTGSVTKDTVLVIYNQSVNFLSSPAFSEEAGYINENVETVVRIAIKENQNILPNAAKLVALDGNGSVVSSDITILKDDGNVANGDDIAGDGVYSSKTTLNKSSAGIYGYRVAVNTGVTEFSSPVYFTVLTPLTDQQIQSAEQQTEKAFSNNFPSPGSKFTESEFGIYKDKVLAELLSFPDVMNAKLSADGNSIAVKFKSGLIHCIDFVIGDTLSGGRSDSSPSAMLSSDQPMLISQPQRAISSLRYIAELKAKASARTSDSQSDSNSIGSYRALGLSPFKWQVGEDGIYDKIRNSTTPKFTTSSALVNYDVTVEHFKNLSQYGVIVITTHGGLEGSDPVIYTGDEATSEKQKKYQKDIDAKRLMVSHKITILVKDGGLLLFDSKEKKEAFKIAPSFITQYNNNMPNTIVYMAMCNGIATDSLSNAFIKAGAGAFVSYTDVVNASYAFNTGQKFVEAMIDGKTVKDAVKEATGAYGVNDGGTTPAAFVYRGNGDLLLERSGIQNGGFEENLKYWEQNGGDIRVLSKLSSLSSQEGSYMAILSSGLGSVNDSDAIITQQFKIPADVSTLTFNYDVVSEEPMEYVGSSFDDKFRAVLIDEEGNEIELANETINTSAWSAISGTQPDGGMFGGGDGTTFHTGWKTVNHQIKSLAGQTVTLKFRVWDVGDSAYDTAALIDKISLK